MQSRVQHIVSIFLLGIFLFVKVISVHTFLHILQDEDVYVENCTHCEYQLQSNEVPFLDNVIVSTSTLLVEVNLEIEVFYIAPLVANNIQYTLSNKAPPVFS